MATRKNIPTAELQSLARHEGLRGKVQCIYFDPPYGIKFNSNFQWSTSNHNFKNMSVTPLLKAKKTYGFFDNHLSHMPIYQEPMQ